MTGEFTYNNIGNNKTDRYDISGDNNRFSYQFINPQKKVIRSLISEGKGPFRYHQSYQLVAKQTGPYSAGAFLVEWFHAQDRYVVQAINVPLRDQVYANAWVKYKGLGHKVDPKVSMLLMFEIRQSQATTHIFNCRVRHVPTKIQLFDWDNFRVPRFTIIREGHEVELQKFLGDRLAIDGRDGGSSYEGEPLKRFEKCKEVWLGTKLKRNESGIAR